MFEASIITPAKKKLKFTRTAANISFPNNSLILGPFARKIVDIAI